MGAITIDGAGVTASRVEGYADAAGTAFRRRKPAWAVATFDMAAVLLAVEAVHAINGMIFAMPPPAEVSTVQETKADQLALSADVEGEAGPPPALARLAADARATIATPDNLIVFAEPQAFVGRFGNAVNAPGEGGFATANARPQAGGQGGNAPPPTTAEPAGPDPTLLAYLPLPQDVSDMAAEAIAKPPLDRVADIAERATGAPLDLTAAARLAIRADANSNRAGSAAQMEVSATAAAGTPVGSTNGGASASANLGAAVGATVSAVTSLLR